MVWMDDSCNSQVYKKAAYIPLVHILSLHWHQILAPRIVFAFRKFQKFAIMMLWYFSATVHGHLCGLTAA